MQSEFVKLLSDRLAGSIWETVYGDSAVEVFVTRQEEDNDVDCPCVVAVGGGELQTSGPDKCLCKVLGRIIRKILCLHLTQHFTLYPPQHRFLKHRSSLTNLLCFLDEVTCGQYDEMAADLWYLDFIGGVWFDNSSSPVAEVVAPWHRWYDTKVGRWFLIGNSFDSWSERLGRTKLWSLLWYFRAPYRNRYRSRCW